MGRNVILVMVRLNDKGWVGGLRRFVQGVKNEIKTVKDNLCRVKLHESCRGDGHADPRMSGAVYEGNKRADL